MKINLITMYPKIRALIAFISFFILFAPLRGQWIDKGVKLTTTDKVGIGTDNPEAFFDVKSSSTALIKIQGDDKGYVNAGIILQANYYKNIRGLGIFLQNMADQREWFFGNPYRDTDNFVITRQANVLSHQNSTAQVENSLFTITKDGKVGIGVNDPDAMLAVKGDIHSQEVKVDLDGAVAPDFVFEKDYPLIDLEQVEDYINTNKHLPGIPSAIEMERNGVELKMMNLSLLQKVEEITLYLIKQNKEIELLKAHINELEGKLGKVSE